MFSKLNDMNECFQILPQEHQLSWRIYTVTRAVSILIDVLRTLNPEWIPVADCQSPARFLACHLVQLDGQVHNFPYNFDCRLYVIILCSSGVFSQEGIAGSTIDDSTILEEGENETGGEPPPATATVTGHPPPHPHLQRRTRSTIRVTKGSTRMRKSRVKAESHGSIAGAKAEN